MNGTRKGMAAGFAMVAWAAMSPAALACEGCKQAVQNGMGETQLSAASIGYGWSVGFMLIMTFSIVGSLAWMMFRSCQTLARVQAAELERDSRLQ